MRQRLAQATALAVGLAPFCVPGLARAQTSAAITGYWTTAGVAISSGPPGTQLVIKGTNLGSSGTLRFGSTTLAYNAWASTYIRVVVPTPGSYPAAEEFSATTAGQTATGPTFTITAPANSTAPTPTPTPSPAPAPPPAPAIRGYTTTAGSALSSAVPDTVVVITGANLGNSGTVKFNGIQASVTNWTSTAITVTVPAASSYPSAGLVTVTTGSQTATGPTFTTTAPATVSTGSTAPASGAIDVRQF